MAGWLRESYPRPSGVGPTSATLASYEDAHFPRPAGPPVFANPLIFVSQDDSARSFCRTMTVPRPKQLPRGLCPPKDRYAI